MGSFNISTYSTSGTTFTPEDARGFTWEDGRGFTWGDGGNKFYTIGTYSVDGGETGQRTQWDVGTPYDISTIQPYPQSTRTSRGQEYNDIFWKPDGTKYWIARGDRRRQVTEYDTSSNPWDFSRNNSDFVTAKEFSDIFEPLYGVAWKDDGTKIFINIGGGTIEEYTVSTAWDLTSNTSLNASHTFSNGVRGLRFNDKGTRLWLNAKNLSDNFIYQYDLNTAWDVSSVSGQTATAPLPEGSEHMHIRWNDEGSQFTVLTQKTVYEYEGIPVQKFEGAFNLSSSVNTEIKTLTGTVDFTGTPVQGAEVYAIRESDQAFIGYDTTDSNGEYSIGIGPASSGDILLVAADYFDGQEYFSKEESVSYNG